MPSGTPGITMNTFQATGRCRGVIYARRYRVHEGTRGYTTVYEFESTAVPESAAWKEQQQHSSPNSPRMRQAMTHAPGSAGVYTRIDP